MRFIGNVEKDAQVRAIASGALPSGDAVIVNSDGTVSVVALASVPDAVGTSVVFNSANSAGISAAYDVSSDKVVIAYSDYGAGGRGTAVVGTVSGTTITFGTPVVFESSNSAIEIRIVYDPDQAKVVVVFQDNSSGSFGQGKAIVGTVSGTTISFGTKVALTAGQTMENFGIAYDTVQQKVVISFRDGTGSNYGACVVGTVSGTSISFGSKTVFNSAVTIRQGMTYDSTAQKIVIAYHDFGATAGNAVVGTVSGTSISFGSEVTFESNAVDFVTCSYDASAGRVVVVYQDGGNSNFITAAVGTVSGTSISFGTPVAFDGAVNSFIGIVYDPNIQKTVIAYQDDGNSGYGTVVTGTVSGTSITFDSPFVFFNGSGTAVITAAYNSAENKVIIGYKPDNTDYGNAIVYRPAGLEANLTAENYIGFAAHTYADTQSAVVNSTCTVDRNQTGLTAGQTYYVQTDGTLDTTAGDPSVVAGTAISSTSIIVKG